MLRRLWDFSLLHIVSSWHYWRSQALRPRMRELFISMVGAALGLLLTSVSSHTFLGSQHPWFMASMGATAVLLFALPASPLAQPWPVLLGTLMAVTVGVSCRHWLGVNEWSASLAGGLAVGLMLFFRCLHPPAGAIAISAVVGGPQIEQLGYAYLVWPALPNTLLILLTAWVFNNLVGRRYPHRSPVTPNTHGTQDAAPTARSGIRAADIRTVLANRPEMLDIAPDDLADLVLAVQNQARFRSRDAQRCGDIMSRDLVFTHAQTSLQTAWDQLAQHRIATLPVVDAHLRLIGILALHDFVVDRTHPDRPRTVDLQASVDSLMTRKVISVQVDTPLDILVQRSADGGLHHIPVTDAAGKLVGIITQSDMLAALYREHVVMAHTPPASPASAPTPSVSPTHP